MASATMKRPRRMTIVGKSGRPNPAYDAAPKRSASKPITRLNFPTPMPEAVLARFRPTRIRPIDKAAKARMSCFE